MADKKFSDLDLSPYAGRWVAVVRNQVAGVGRTSDEARRAAQLSRPKERPHLVFVTVDDWHDRPPLRRLWGLLNERRASVLLVGGAVRDGLLGRHYYDLDFAVDGDAAELAAAVARAFGGIVVPLDRERDVVRVVVRQAENQFFLDFARRQGHDWAADLRARDFTVNAIAVDRHGHYLDPLGGRDDLAAGLLRATNAGAFQDDPLRTLRAVRLRAELGLEIEPHTTGWIRRDAHLLRHTARERIRDEFVRILGARSAAQHLGMLNDLHLLAQVIPEVEATQDVQQSAPHQWDVWHHTRMAVAALEGVLGFIEERDAHSDSLQVPGWIWGDVEKRLGSLRAELAAHLQRVVSDVRDRRFALKMAGLLHDIGKPLTGTVGDDRRFHFFGHEQVGAELAQKRLQALRFSNGEVDLVQTIIAHHLRPGQLARARGLSRRAIYRYFRATGDAGVEICLLSLADMLATWGAALPSSRWLRRLDVVAGLLSAFFERSDSVAPATIVDGHQLMDVLNLTPGPHIGRLLDAIREAQAVGEIQSRAAALALAEKIMREQQPANQNASGIERET